MNSTDDLQEFRSDSRQVLIEYQRMTQTATEYDRKHVYRIECGDCSTTLTDRGMNAVLLSDRSIQLYSTDLLPSTIAFVQGDYSAASCSCRVRDIACLNCGGVVGYHVNVPCKMCLSQPNNGHYWMFRSLEITAQQIFVQLGPKRTNLPLLWGFVREAGDFGTGSYRVGDDEAAKASSQLSVHLPSSVDLVVHRPVIRCVIAQTLDDESASYHHVQYCR